MWDRQVFKNFYIGPYMAKYGNGRDKYLKSPKYGHKYRAIMGQTNI